MMRGLMAGMFGMGVVFAAHLSLKLKETVRAAGGRNTPVNNMANRAAALGMLKAWALFNAARKDIAYYSSFRM